MPATQRWIESRMLGPRGWTIYLGVIATAVVVLVLFATGTLDSGTIATPGQGLLLCLLILAVLVCLWAILGGPLYAYFGRRIQARLRRHPWQAWPVLAERQGVVELLDPEGQVFKTFVNSTPMPRPVWEGLTDGLGVLWICGDLREEITMAAPGGGQIWTAKVLQQAQAPASATADPGLLESTISSAASDFVQAWLKEHL
ncbi:hypothetical protein [Glycomyces sp. NPDC048151]|uniref:hypothetical protein n=1 Tax=Glycomyces sp. NPDC048151 TaxID=3364002 RepID=UPI0037239273